MHSLMPDRPQKQAIGKAEVDRESHQQLLLVNEQRSQKINPLIMCVQAGFC